MPTLNQLPGMVEARSLSKSYRLQSQRLQAVRGVSFVCEPGRVHGILGPNGAGKTTCLRLVSGSIRPDSGELRIGGSPQSPDGLRRMVGFVSPTMGVYDRQTPFEFIRYFARLSGLEGDPLNSRVESILNELNINEYRNRRCGQLSHGMIQRISIARALVHDPPILVLDEPTNGLDVLGRRATIQYIRKLKGRGRTVLLATNLAADAEALCDSVTLLNHGRVVESGGLEQLKQHHRSPDLEDVFVRLFDAPP